MTASAMTLRLALTAPATAPLPIELVLAVPRPKVLTRVIETAAAFGVARIDLTNAWRVDKSYLRSPRLAPDALAQRAAARRRARRDHAPPADRGARPPDGAARRAVAGAPTPARKLIAHPGAPPIERATLDAGRSSLAIGPEGGWIQRELETFVERGFTPVSIGAPILRVEAALAAALGQLLVLQRLAASPPA